MTEKDVIWRFCSKIEAEVRNMTARDVAEYNSRNPVPKAHTGIRFFGGAAGGYGSSYWTIFFDKDGKWLPEHDSATQ